MMAPGLRVFPVSGDDVIRLHFVGVTLGCPEGYEVIVTIFIVRVDSVDAVGVDGATVLLGVLTLGFKY